MLGLTAREMQVDFERMAMLYDSNMEIKEKMTTENIFYFINLAQERYIKERYLPSSSQLAKDEKFIQKRYDDLRKLVKRTVANIKANLTNDFPADYNFVVGVDLPSDYLFYVRSDSKITRSFLFPENNNAYWVPNRVIDHYDIDNVLTTPFNKPILREPCIIFEEGNEMHIYHDEHTDIVSINLTYMRQPKKITPETLGPDGDANTIWSQDDYTNTCELAPHTHEEIVDLAVKIFVEEIKVKGVKIGESKTRDELK